jgi:hypothetical protein
MYTRIALKYDQSNNIIEVPFDKIGNDTSVFVAIAIKLTDFVTLQNKENATKKKDFIKSIIDNSGNLQNYGSVLVYCTDNRTLWFNVFDYIRYLTQTPLSNDPENNFSALYTNVNLSTHVPESWINFNNNQVYIDGANFKFHHKSQGALKEFDIFNICDGTQIGNVPGAQNKPYIAVSSISQDTDGVGLDLNNVKVFCLTFGDIGVPYRIFTPCFLNDQILIPVTNFRDFTVGANSLQPINISKTQDRISFTNSQSVVYPGLPAVRASYITNPYDLRERITYSSGTGLNMTPQTIYTSVSGGVYGDGQTVFMTMELSDGVEPNNIIKSSYITYDNTPINNAFNLSSGDHVYAILSDSVGVCYNDKQCINASAVCYTRQESAIGNTIFYTNLDYSRATIPSDGRQPRNVYTKNRLAILRGTNDNNVTGVVNTSNIVCWQNGILLSDGNFQSLLSTHDIYVCGFGDMYDMTGGTPSSITQQQIALAGAFIAKIDNKSITFFNAIPNNSQPSVKNANGEYIALHAKSGLLTLDGNRFYGCIPGSIDKSSYYTASPYTRGDNSNIDVIQMVTDSWSLLLVKK